MMNVLRTIQLEESHGVCVKLEILAEDVPVQGNASCIDHETDTTTENAIFAESEDNIYAWCTLHVVAELAGSPEIYGDDFLGCVSILKRYLPSLSTLECEAKQMVKDHDMIANAKGELQRAIVGVEMSITDFRAEA